MSNNNDTLTESFYACAQSAISETSLDNSNSTTASLGDVHQIKDINQSQNLHEESSEYIAVSTNLGSMNNDEDDPALSTLQKFRKNMELRNKERMKELQRLDEELANERAKNQAERDRRLQEKTNKVLSRKLTTGSWTNKVQQSSDKIKMVEKDSEKRSRSRQASREANKKIEQSEAKRMVNNRRKRKSVSISFF